MFLDVAVVPGKRIHSRFDTGQCGVRIHPAIDERQDRADRIVQHALQFLHVRRAHRAAGRNGNGQESASRRQVACDEVSSVDVLVGEDQVGRQAPRREVFVLQVCTDADSLGDALDRQTEVIARPILVVAECPPSTSWEAVGSRCGVSLEFPHRWCFRIKSGFEMVKVACTVWKCAHRNPSKKPEHNRRRPHPYVGSH